MADNAITAGLQSFGSVLGLKKQAAELEHGKKLMESAQRLLPAKEQAEQTGYETDTAENLSKQKLLPFQTDNQVKEQQIKGVGLDAAAKRQPTTEATADVNAQYALSDAQNKVSMQPVTQDTANTQAQTANVQARGIFDQSAEALRQAKGNQIISGAQQADIMFANLGSLLSEGRHDDAKAYANAIIANKNLFPNTNDLGSVTDIKNTPNGVEFSFQNGQPMVVPAGAFTSAMARARGGDYHHVESDGNVFLYDKKTGKSSQLAKADPTVTGSNKMGPLERDVNYLTRAHGMKPDQALSYINSAKTKSEKEFVLEGIKAKNDMGQKTSDQDVANLRNLYKQATGGDIGLNATPSTATNTSNTNQPATVNPQVKSLIGIP